VEQVPEVAIRLMPPCLAERFPATLRLCTKVKVREGKSLVQVIYREPTANGGQTMAKATQGMTGLTKQAQGRQDIGMTSRCVLNCGSNYRRSLSLTNQ
jgi:hypothetical protein